MAKKTGHEEQRFLRNQILELGLDYSHMTEAGYDGILSHFGGTIVEGNEAFARMIECAREETIGLNAFKLYPPENIDVVMQKFKGAPEEPYEVAAITLKGKPFLVNIWG